MDKNWEKRRQSVEIHAENNEKPDKKTKKKNALIDFTRFDSVPTFTGTVA